MNPAVLKKSSLKIRTKYLKEFKATMSSSTKKVRRIVLSDDEEEAEKADDNPVVNRSITSKDVSGALPQENMISVMAGQDQFEDLTVMRFQSNTRSLRSHYR